ncbi:MAG: hypothetical protein ACYDEN_06320 [Acidimicrobiales bacterium]
MAWPLPCTEGRHRAALMVFLDRELAPEEGLALRSLCSLIPVAFERALGTGTTVRQEAHLRAVLDGSPVALLTFAGDVRPELVQMASEVARTGALVSRPVVTDRFDLDVSAEP